MYLYNCGACIRGEHAKCERVHSCPPGQFGGSKCVCPCDGNPDYMQTQALGLASEDIFKSAPAALDAANPKKIYPGNFA